MSVTSDSDICNEFTDDTEVTMEDELLTPSFRLLKSPSKDLLGWALQNASFKDSERMIQWLSQWTLMIKNNSMTVDDVWGRCGQKVSDMEEIYRKHLDAMREALTKTVKRQRNSKESAQRLEVMMLETMEILERNRVVAVGRLWVEALQITVDVDDVPFNDDSNVNADNPITLSSSSNDTDDVLFPDEILELRRQIVVQMAERDETVARTKKLSSQLQQRLTQLTNYKQGMEKLLLQVAHDEICAPTSQKVQLLRQTLKTLWQEQNQSVTKLLETITSAHQRVKELVWMGERAGKTAADTEKAMWGQLRQAARDQANAEEAYRQQLVATDKARQKVQSVEDEQKLEEPLEIKKPESKMSPLRRMNANNTKAMKKGLANMLSILPDGGDQAMKIFNSSARAQQYLETADEKQSQGRLQLNAAVEATAKAMEAYRVNAQTLLSERSKKDEDKDTVAMDAVKQCQEALLNFRQQRDETMLKVRRGWLPPVPYHLLQDVDAWVLAKEDELQVLSHRQASSNDEYESDNESILDTASSGEANDETASTEGEESSRNWLTRGRGRAGSLASLQGSLHSNFSFSALKKNIGKRSRSSSGSDQLDLDDAEADLLLTVFSASVDDKQMVPDAVSSFACSVRLAGEVFPSQYGRLYICKDRLLFVGWVNKKITWMWTEVTQVKASRQSLTRPMDAIRLKSVSDGVESTLILGGVSDREEKLAVLEKTRFDASEEMKLLREEANKVLVKTDLQKSLAATTVEVPPDATLEKMEIVLHKTIRKTSTRRFYEIVWSEGQGTNEAPLYKPWLEKEAFDIDVSLWKMNQKKGQWCDEDYTQHRSVSFKIKRRTHLYIGPPIANVHQTHYCRVDEDVCVVAMSVDMSGIPYSDCFAVEVRWVARRVGVDDLELRVGIFVNFRKRTMLKQKIRSGTIEESTPAIKRLYELAHNACAAAAGEEAPAYDDGEQSDVETPLASREERSSGFANVLTSNPFVVVLLPLLLYLLYKWTFLSPVSEQDRLEKLEMEVQELQETLKEVLHELKTQRDQNCQV